MRSAIALTVLLALNFSAPAADGTLPPTEADVRRDCTADALRYCKAAILTGNRMEVIACMVANKEKLRAKCARYLW